MSVDAVALLRIPDFVPPDDLDVRELSDGFLVYLEQPYDAEDDDLLLALDELFGEALDDHDDERGVFVLPDTLDPDDADTYEAVLAAVDQEGRFLALDAGPGLLAGDLGAGMQGALVEAMQAMGLGDASEVQRMLSGDQDAMLMAQIRMQRALEESMVEAQNAAPSGDAQTEPEKPA